MCSKRKTRDSPDRRCFTALPMNINILVLLLNLLNYRLSALRGIASNIKPTKEKKGKRKITIHFQGIEYRKVFIHSSQLEPG